MLPPAGAADLHPATAARERVVDREPGVRRGVVSDVRRGPLRRGLAHDAADLVRRLRLIRAPGRRRCYRSSPSSPPQALAGMPRVSLRRFRPPRARLRRGRDGPGDRSAPWSPEDAPTNATPAWLKSLSSDAWPGELRCRPSSWTPRSPRSPRSRKSHPRAGRYRTWTMPRPARSSPRARSRAPHSTFQELFQLPAAGRVRRGQACGSLLTDAGDRRLGARPKVLSNVFRSDWKCWDRRRRRRSRIVSPVPSPFTLPKLMLLNP